MVKVKNCHENTDKDRNEIIPKENNFRKIAENVGVIARDAGKTLGAISE